MSSSKLCFSALLACCFVCSSAVIPFSAKPLGLAVPSPWIIYTGSTPAGTFIRSTLKLPADVKIDFIKWNLYLSADNSGSGTFKLTALYGESQPNTNGFWNGGTQLEISGKCNVQSKSWKNNKPIMTLETDALQSSIMLLKLDDNLLYFLGQNNDLLVGNGGFSYLLNRVNNK
ncbi:MAG TPA: hypothetical protein VFV68_00370 [Agriterribacter sp.]|nr:hypothetical protein [Agriterribacter sp.]